MNFGSRLPLGAPHPAEADVAGMLALLDKIERERGFNCRHYKDKCLRRRVAVRLRAVGQQSLAAYSSLLDTDAGEYDRLLDTLTVNVSKFFRNHEMWELLRRDVLPKLFHGNERLRFWSAGCAAGEEAYSLSISWQQWAEEQRVCPLRPPDILATDIDRGSLERAAAGIYGELALAETPAPMRERWFSAGPPFRLAEAAKRGVRFARHDLISDPPLGAMDLILCRNVVIYLDREIQDTIFRRLHQQLRPGGVLVLGKVETLFGSLRQLFRPIDNRARIYEKVP